MPTKTSSPATSSSPALSERENFFQRCYISLLSSCLSQFEVRDENGDLRLVFDHPKFEAKEEAVSEAFNRDDHKLNGKARQDALQKSIDKSESLTRQMREEDIQWRIEMLVDYAYRLATAATNRYFEATDFASQCNDAD